MTDSEQSFLEAIIADPENDLPRLVYADALDGGDGGFPADPERAEFIRVQIRLARTECSTLCTKSKCVCERHNLRCREWQLLKVAQRWLPIASLWSGTGMHQTFCRGFAERLTCPWPDFARHADAIREQTPLREVTLTTDPWISLGNSDPRTNPPTFTKQLYHPQSSYPIASTRYPEETSMDEILAAEYPGIAFTLPRSHDMPYGGSHYGLLSHQTNDADNHILYGDPSAPRQHYGIINARGSR